MKCMGGWQVGGGISQESVVEFSSDMVCILTSCIKICTLFLIYFSGECLIPAIVHGYFSYKFWQKKLREIEAKRHEKRKRAVDELQEWQPKERKVTQRIQAGVPHPLQTVPPLPMIQPHIFHIALAGNIVTIEL